MKNLLLVGLASLVLACSSQETRCRELTTQLETTRIEMDYQSGKSEREFRRLEGKYSELRKSHYEECNQVPVNIE